MKLLVGYDLDDREEGRKGGIPAPGSLGLLSYDTRTDAEPLILDELGCKEGCSAFGQSTQVTCTVCCAFRSALCSNLVVEVLVVEQFNRSVSL